MEVSLDPAGGKVQAPAALDPVTVQVIRNSLIAAADEMKLTLAKTAYNDLLYEVQDFGVILTTADGELIAQSDTLPIFLSVLSYCVKAGIEKLGADGFREGDLIIANDPYTTGTHVSDTAVYGPIYVDGRLVGFSACMAHWADIGAKAPGGWCCDTTDVFQEGILLDHVKLVDRGVTNTVLLDVIWSNIRLPGISKGDLGAQLAACKTGARRLHEIYERYGADVVERAVALSFDQAEKAMRQEIEAIPDGVYNAHTFLDHDGVDRDREVRIEVTVRVDGSEIVADFTGTDPATQGPVNCPFPGMAAGIEMAIKGVTLPLERANAGHLRPLRVVAPAGTVANPVFPSPVDSYCYAPLAAAYLVWQALAGAMPERCAAAGYQVCLMYFIRPATRSTKDARVISDSAFVLLEPVVGGSGATARGNGATLAHLAAGDSPMQSTEIIEAKYAVRIRQYALDVGGAGAGRYRGGMGVVKEYEMLEGEQYAQITMEATHYPPWGLHGGGDAMPGRVIAWPGTEREEVISEKRDYVGPIVAGDRVVAIASGGGGWGSPHDRPVEEVASDVWNEYVTVAEAADVYGVIFEPGTLVVDVQATEEARREA